jgi:hypothetical protein
VPNRAAPLLDVSPIVRDVPVPAPNDWLRRYPFEALLPGDSFTVPVEIAHSTRVALQRHKVKYPKRHFVTRIEGERCRVWRVK